MFQASPTSFYGYTPGCQWRASCLDDVGDGTEALGDDTVTDVEISLGGQRDRQPDGRRVEHGRNVVGEPVVNQTPARTPHFILALLYS